MSLSIASPDALKRRVGAVAPARGDDQPVGDEDGRDEHALLSRPPPLWRRSKTMPSAPSSSSSRTFLPTHAVRAGGELAQRRRSRPSCRRGLSMRFSETGTETLARARRRRRAPCRRVTIVSLTIVPAGPLDLRRRRPRWTCPSSDLPLTATIRSPFFEAGLLGRAVLEDVEDRAARAGPPRRSCRRPRSAPRGGLELGRTRVGVDVAAEAVAEASTAAARLVEQRLLAVDLAVEVVVDRSSASW